MSFDEWLDAEELLEQGAQHRWPERDVSTLEVVEVCHLDLATGRVVAVDPAYFHSFEDARPVVAEVAPGTYPVLLSVVAWPSTEESHRDSRAVTAATLKISDAPVARWEWLDERADGTVLGVGVDAGTACFYDASQRESLALLSEDEDRVEAALFEAADAGFAAVPDASGGTAAVFIGCGMGDGFYPIRIGRDASDRVAMVMIDLELLNHSTGRVDPASNRT
ncbi:DUF4241 domain-containing protein [Kribbella albertanoniae]|uniref:DUF4241 domain-containing protein n=1 Tax=Kribbella albertanoniae TaxID=1266829 RepID=A0A4R4PLM3_9ACTN|nr:DUF4241 domain-containing protein [Kribbella albertanoniae]TDC22889.1 DUF4241 domain-containing protein [Kribbella albertanoniae]